MHCHFYFFYPKKTKNIPASTLLKTPLFAENCGVVKKAFKFRFGEKNLLRVYVKLKLPKYKTQRDFLFFASNFFLFKLPIDIKLFRYRSDCNQVLFCDKLCFDENCSPSRSLIWR